MKHLALDAYYLKQLFTLLSTNILLIFSANFNEGIRKFSNKSIYFYPHTYTFLSK